MGDEKAEEDPTFVSVPLLALCADEIFPGPIYLCLHHKMVRYRNAGDTLDVDSFNKLVYNHVRYIFIEENDRKAFDDFRGKLETRESMATEKIASPDTAEVIDVVQAQRRAMMDIFESPRDDKAVKQAVEVSKKLVTEFLRKPFAVNNISALQRYSRGAVDHSVNVSVLSVFLGLRMGYTHQIILENLALGGLFHDIGKMLVEPSAEGMRDDNDPAMQLHPRLGQDLLDRNKDIANEVRMIVAQHHEFLDGTGYPSRLKGLAVYDLARLVGIANIYDNLITDSKKPNMKERQIDALERLEKEFVDKLDAKKLEKVAKILRYSFL